MANISHLQRRIEHLRTTFPWTSQPLIVNAPMGGIAGPRLAVSVSRANGLGLIGTVNDTSQFDKWFTEAEQAFESDPLNFVADSSKTSSGHAYLPVGFGFLAFITDLNEVLKVMGKHPKPPAVVWLFASKEPVLEIYTKWAEVVRGHYDDRGLPAPQIWIQCGGSAAMALRFARSKELRPDALVIQGSDAGGHGPERGASVIALVPDVIDTLAANGITDLPILASGGITEGRAAAAAFTLGACGVIMGTRFLASPETQLPNPAYLDRILEARDGAMSTVRAKVFDELRGPNAWPVEYDGRALVSKSWTEYVQEGVPIEMIRKGMAEVATGKDAGYGAETHRAAVWAGAGVGLVNDIKPAADVVRDTRDEALKILEGMRSSITHKL